MWIWPAESLFIALLIAALGTAQTVVIRVLIANDEAGIRAAYREVFEDLRLSSSRAMTQNLRASCNTSHPALSG